MSNFSCTYVRQTTANAEQWIPLTVNGAPGLAPGFTTFALTYGLDFGGPIPTQPNLAVSASVLGSSFLIDAGTRVPRGLFTISGTYALNAALTSVVPARMLDETAATIAPVADAALRHASLTYVFNGTNFVRALSGTAASLATLSPSAAQLVASAGEWSINHTPATNVQATISRAAVASQRHVCRSVTATLIGLAASAEATVLVNLRDGATGAGSILWSARLLVTGTQGSESGVTLSGLNIVGTANTAMTLEFEAAGGASTFETVALTGNTAA